MNDEEPALNGKSKAELAREARRRRILENGNNRLGKITGRVHNEEIIVSNTNINSDIYPDPELERDVFEGPTDFGSENQDIFELLRNLQGNSQNIQQTSQAPQEPVIETVPEKLLRSKITVVALSFIAYILFALNLEKYVGGSVFSILISWEVVTFISAAFIIRQPAQHGGILNIILMFLGYRPENVQLMLKCLQQFNKIIQDLSIFIFTFVFSHVIYSYFLLGESLNVILDKDFSNLFSSK